ncbi:MAG TPA: CARDB domain-containing protein [Bacteroidales bacterium]|nr:CARDB domain-containing protein [Bacteroidales bacterium]
MNIKNQGNYISGPSITKYYLSADTLWDGSDFSLGQVGVPQIRPDMSYYINEMFNAPANLVNYNYLIYKVDANNTNAESNELNNTGYWNLALDSISSYPYFMDFNDTVVNGWHHYVKTYTGVHWKDKFRFRNMVVPGEGNELNDRKSGQMFTDKIGLIFNTNYLPFWYLESPSFDFSKTEKISLSFDLMCIGYASGCGLSDDQGGNFEFSTDGGNTWTLLTTQYGQAYNWYDFSSLGLLFYQPGWSGYSMPNNIVTLDSTAFDISFLKGNAHVVFRFKFRAAEEIWNNGSAQGMRVDNFSIEGFSLDYEANDSLVPVDVPLNQPGFDINYSITNTGQVDGPATTVKFFWSNDSILNSSDSLLYTGSVSPVTSGNTFASSAHITYPPPFTQATYYLFYLADADSGLVETDELNNIGSYKITFPYNSINENSPDNIDMYVYGGKLYITIPENTGDGSSFDCCLTDAGGRLVYHTEIGLKAGINILQLPDNLSGGTYLILIKNQRFVLSKKIFF